MEVEAQATRAAAVDRDVEKGGEGGVEEVASSVVPPRGSMFINSVVEGSKLELVSDQSSTATGEEAEPAAAAAPADLFTEAHYFLESECGALERYGVAKCSRTIADILDRGARQSC
jgi:hypothetical protein